MRQRPAFRACLRFRTGPAGSAMPASTMDNIRSASFSSAVSVAIAIALTRVTMSGKLTSVRTAPPSRARCNSEQPIASTAAWHAATRSESARRPVANAAARPCLELTCLSQPGHPRLRHAVLHAASQTPRPAANGVPDLRLPCRLPSLPAHALSLAGQQRKYHPIVKEHRNFHPTQLASEASTRSDVAGAFCASCTRDASPSLV
jgi:hypothetical protein